MRTATPPRAFRSISTWTAIRTRTSLDAAPRLTDRQLLSSTRTVACPTRTFPPSATSAMRERRLNCILNALLPCSENRVAAGPSPTPEDGRAPPEFLHPHYPYHPRSFLKDSSTFCRTSPRSFRRRTLRRRGADAGSMASVLTSLTFLFRYGSRRNRTLYCRYG